MALNQFIRDKNTGQNYELTAGGYYKKIDAPGTGAVDVNGINDAFMKEATNELGASYDVQTEDQKLQNDVTLKKMQARLKQNYNDSGMLDSTYYNNDSADTDRTMASQNNAALERIKLAKTGAITSRVSELQSKQMTGEQADYERAQAEKAAVEKAKADAEERAYNQKMQELALEQQRLQTEAAKATASAKTSSASTKKAPTKNQILTSLQSDISGGINAIIQGGNKAWATETLIQQLQNAYPELSPSDIANRVYAYRKPLESKYKF